MNIYKPFYAVGVKVKLKFSGNTNLLFSAYYVLLHTSTFSFSFSFYNKKWPKIHQKALVIKKMYGKVYKKDYPPQLQKKPKMVNKYQHIQRYIKLSFSLFNMGRVNLNNLILLSLLD